MTNAKKKGRGRMSPRRIAQADARRRALEMRRKGASFDEIAQALGYSSRAAAWGAIAYELSLLRQETIEDMRAIEGQRLEALVAALWPRCVAKPPDIESIKTLIQVLRRKARLFGLDLTAPATATATAEARVVIQLGSGEPREIHELTDSELVNYIRELEPLVQPLQIAQHTGEADDPR